MQGHIVSAASRPRMGRLAEISLLALGIVLSGAASAQNAPPPAIPPSASGVGQVTKDPAQLDKGHNTVLPSAGTSGPSAAPTMVFDCKAKPQECTTPVTAADKASAPDQSSPPATPKP